MISLMRLHYPLRWSDLYPWFPGRKRWFMQCAFYWFVDYMVYNWGYLLLNNMEYWRPYLVLSCEAIRIKLQNLNYASWRQAHPSIIENRSRGFDYAMFIDNTMIAFCRPGGNTAEREAAPRVPLEVQQAWYTGWKSFMD